MRIAAAQTDPVWGDPVATAAKAVDWIGRAADEGADLVAFGETFLSGYPFWLSETGGARFDDAFQKDAYAMYLDAAIPLDGPEFSDVVKAAREAGVFTYIGVAERSTTRGTVYATFVAIDPDQGVVSAHRKLMPTYEERLVWGIGDGHGLRAHELGSARVGGLNCWENWIPAVRHVMYAQGVDIHVAAWPGNVRNTEEITRFIALEGRCFVLSASSLLTRAAVPDDFAPKDQAFGDQDMLYNGGSAIAGPDGRWLVEPVAGEETLVWADIDLARVREERQNFDPAGHYFRADVIDVSVDRTRLEGARFRDS